MFLMMVPGRELDGTRAYLETDTGEMSVVNAHLNDLPSILVSFLLLYYLP